MAPNVQRGFTVDHKKLRITLGIDADRSGDDGSFIGWQGGEHNLSGERSMKKILSVLLAFAFLAVQANAAVKTFQVTIGASTTQVSTTPVLCQWVVFQNNAAHSARLGDINTTSSIGILLAGGSPGGSFYQGPIPNAGTTNLQQFYLAGTQNDVIDVVCNVIG